MLFEQIFEVIIIKCRKTPLVSDTAVDSDSISDSHPSVLSLTGNFWTVSVTSVDSDSNFTGSFWTDSAVGIGKGVSGLREANLTKTHAPDKHVLSPLNTNRSPAHLHLCMEDNQFVSNTFSGTKKILIHQDPIWYWYHM